MSTDDKKDDYDVEETKTPDEDSGVYIETHIKIFDPESEEIYVNQRA